MVKKILALVMTLVIVKKFILPFMTVKRQQVSQNGEGETNGTTTSIKMAHDRELKPEDEEADRRILNINEASEEELLHIPGIGSDLSKKIVHVRTNIGDYNRIEDLLQVTGIGDRKLATIKPYITVT
ncbi:helix-hairpin-helix domain-containing protein [Salipaludibacillus agaradhaerens]|jgi:competence ComEA-like helix-hairpin-helix protein|uniref:ComEA family DNA-binding protein n=1 Tax=Salipaludibacillus agaradhaerens TaxID=76935 RepID=UPI002150CB29|nr:helix-hairpin-helix domain-containing protein [Salipaludibacillus agaradhaerens]MCR6108048.1 helix-hairpin-helix domain-containing protein [Salipaludibacillus agaradhaerens]MCR6120073.1 helix-hairpin-helix domain-containing protein [Salipaludibacillus agaradhaerens]UJW59123.1 helix-hairpin-helix domain-containing protein [Bacillus sp. A116_S68]